MISTRVGLQAALNGDRTKAAHAATPLSVEELAHAATCVAAGARAIHLRPRDPEGRETLGAGIVDEVVTKVREVCGVPVGVTTSAETEPDPERRLGQGVVLCHGECLKVAALKIASSSPVGNLQNPASFAGAAAVTSTFCHCAALRPLPLPLREVWFRVLLTDDRLHL